MALIRCWLLVVSLLFPRDPSGPPGETWSMKSYQCGEIMKLQVGLKVRSWTKHKIDKPAIAYTTKEIHISDAAHVLMICCAIIVQTSGFAFALQNRTAHHLVVQPICVTVKHTNNYAEMRSTDQTPITNNQGSMTWLKRPGLSKTCLSITRPVIFAAFRGLAR